MIEFWSKILFDKIQFFSYHKRYTNELLSLVSTKAFVGLITASSELVVEHFSFWTNWWSNILVVVTIANLEICRTNIRANISTPPTVPFHVTTLIKKSHFSFLISFNSLFLYVWSLLGLFSKERPLHILLALPIFYLHKMTWIFKRRGKRRAKSFEIFQLVNFLMFVFGYSL